MMYPQFPGNPYPYPYMPQQSMMYPMGMMGITWKLWRSEEHTSELQSL